MPGGTDPYDYRGTQRVELVVRMSTQLVDVCNFDLILKPLTHIEQASLLHRLGWLNIWNPLKPEGHYHLDLSIREQNLIARALVLLDRAETHNRSKERKLRSMKLISSNTSASNSEGKEVEKITSTSTTETSTTGIDMGSKTGQVDIDNHQVVQVWTPPPIECETYSGDPSNWLSSTQFPSHGDLTCEYYSDLTHANVNRDGEVKVDSTKRLALLAIVQAEPPVEMMRGTKGKHLLDSIPQATREGKTSSNNSTANQLSMDKLKFFTYAVLPESADLHFNLSAFDDDKFSEADTETI